MIAQEDPELRAWLFGIVNSKPMPAGSFLRSLADAALHADFINYQTLRPALINIRYRFPKYNDPEAEK